MSLRPDPRRPDFYRTVTEAKHGPTRLAPMIFSSTTQTLSGLPASQGHLAGWTRGQIAHGDRRG